MEDELLADLYITVEVPPLDDPPAGWPGRELPTRLAELSANVPAEGLDLDFPTEVPDSHEGRRGLDLASELAVVMRGWNEPA